jgi:hypothetical protein
VNDRELTFGVSGMLYKANVLMYDRQTESLWSQVRREAVAGPLTGEELEVLPSTLTNWGKWRKRFPGAEVLSLETGYDRDYSQDPYADYYESKKGFFSFFTPGPGEEEKALVAGITIEGRAKAYPLKVLREQKIITDSFSGKQLTLSYNPETDQISIRTDAGDELIPLVLYWFVWKGMYSNSEIFSAMK